jgi:DNA helicase HerA-like ATPase
VGAITPEERNQIIQSSNIAGHYEKLIDRESAYEKLQARTGEKAESVGAPPATPGASVPEAARPSLLEQFGSLFQPTIGPRGAIHDSVATSMAKSAMRAASSQVGRQIVRGILGGVLGGGRR